MPVSTALLANLALVVAILGGGIALERRLGLRGVRASLPDRLRTGIDLLAFGIYAPLLFGQPVEVPVLNETILALGVFVVCWLGLPLVATSLIDGQPPAQPTGNGCDR